MLGGINNKQKCLPGDEINEIRLLNSAENTPVFSAEFYSRI